MKHKLTRSISIIIVAFLIWQEAAWAVRAAAILHPRGAGGYSLRPQAMEEREEAKVDLRTGDEIVREIFDVPWFTGAFRRIIRGVIQPLISASRYDECVSAVEKALSALRTRGKDNFSPAEINHLRFCLGRVLVQYQCWGALAGSLAKDIPNERYRPAYRILYLGLIAEACYKEGNYQLQLGNCDAAGICLVEAIRKFKDRRMLIDEEYGRLCGLSVDPSLKEKQRQAIKEVERAKEENDYGINTASCAIVTAIAILPPERISEGRLLEYISHVRNMLKRHKSGDSRLDPDILIKLQKGAVFIYIRAGYLILPDPEFGDEFYNLFQEVLATIPEDTITIPTYGEVDLAPYRKSQPPGHVHPSKSTDAAMSSI